MTGLLEPHAVGRDLVRRDGADKVRGTATYAYETPVPNPAYCHPVQATIARGRVTWVDTAAAEVVEGVLAVLRHRLGDRRPAQGPEGARPAGGYPGPLGR